MENLNREYEIELSKARSRLESILNNAIYEFSKNEISYKKWEKIHGEYIRLLLLTYTLHISLDDKFYDLLSDLNTELVNASESSKVICSSSEEEKSLYNRTYSLIRD